MKTTKAVGLGILVVALLLALYVSFVLRLQNPTLSETQLALRFWPYIAAVFAGLLAGGLLVRRANDAEDAEWMRRLRTPRGTEEGA